MLSSDFHSKKNDGTTGAAHLYQTFLAISPDIRRVRSVVFRLIYIINDFIKL